MQIDRLLGILTVLLQNDRVTAPFLAEKFEVSRRTIMRDVDALSRAGIPLVLYRGSGGGIAILDGFRIDKSVLTMDEFSNIVAGLRGIGSVTDTSRIERIFEKLRVGSDAVVSIREPIVIDLYPHNQDHVAQNIALMKRAIRESALVEFTYYSEKEESHRRVEPYFIAFKWSSWYAFGFCLSRQDWRLFKLSRLHDLKLCEDHFICREIPPERKNFAPDTADDKVLTMLFDPSIRHEVIAHYGRDGFVETEKGLLVETRFGNRWFVLEFLRGFGSKVKVLAPKDIAEELRRDAEKIAALYR